MNNQKHIKTRSKASSQSNNVKSKITEKGSKKSPIALVAIVAFLVGAALLFGIALQSFKTAMLANSLNGSHGKVYLATKCASEDCEKEIENIRTRHHGENVGTNKLYQDTAIGGGYEILSLDVASNFLVADPSELVDDKIPVLVPDTLTLSEIPDYFFAVGSYDNSTLQELRDFRAGIFTLVLGKLTPNYSPIFLIDDGSDKIDNFLAEQRLARLKNAALESDSFEDFLKHEQVVVTFKTDRDAINYQKEVSKIQGATTDEFFGNVLGIDYAFSQVYVLLAIGLVILVVLGVAIAIVVKATRELLAAKGA